jgi:hypothetical protein
MARTMYTREVGNLVISRQTRDTPTDWEWREFLDVVTKNRAKATKTRILVVTDGGGPNPEQRKQLQKALSGHTFRVAVVTDSIKVRFIVSSVALLNSEIQTFSIADMGRACEYLGLSKQEIEVALKVAQELGRDLVG